MSAALRYLAALLILAALGAGGYAAWSYRSMTTRVATLEQTARQFDDLSKKFDALSKEVARRRDTDQSIRDRRAAVSQSLENASHEDQPTADFLRTPLPDGLRRAYQRAHTQPLPDPNGH